MASSACFPPLDFMTVSMRSVAAATNETTNNPMGTNTSNSNNTVTSAAARCRPPVTWPTRFSNGRAKMANHDAKTRGCHSGQTIIMAATANKMAVHRSARGWELELSGDSVKGAALLV
jgi:hypothetical protein